MVSRSNGGRNDLSAIGLKDCASNKERRILHIVEDVSSNQEIQSDIVKCTAHH